METSGPEGKNVLGHFAENEIQAFFESFAGWSLLAKNRDFCDRGLDFLFAYSDPYTGFLEGVVVETKHLESGSFSKSTLKQKIEPLYSKIQTFSTCGALWNDDHICGRVQRIKMGVTALRFKTFNRQAYSATLASFDPKDIPGSDKVSVMVVLSNDRLAAFAGLCNYAKGREIVWPYFGYMKNSHPITTKVLSLPLMVSDLIPGFFRSNEKMEPFVLCFQHPNQEFFDFFPSFEKAFQFDPNYFLFTQGRPDQISTYSQYLDGSSKNRVIQIIGKDDQLDIDLSSVFCRPPEN